MAAYGLATFTGAFLLFQIQPLMGKYLLPWFGGAPGLWTACLLFFEVMLLAGYAYAHLSVRYLKPRVQLLLHLLLLAIAVVSLPIIPNPARRPVPGSDPVFQVLSVLVFTIGLPYFVLSATAPLVQHWASRTYPQRSPFRLYAISNGASLLALLSYPSIFEVHLTRATQAHLWSAGLCLYALSCVWAGLRLWRTVGSGNPIALPLPPSQTTFRDRLLWLALPGCASLLLLAVTNTICQDIAAVPLLWVLPLALYLLSFTICFAGDKWYPRGAFGVALFPLLAALCGFRSGMFQPPMAVQIIVYCAGLFVCCMACHGEIYRLKPEPARATAFYLSVAAGGALGGMAVTLLAPLVFTDYFEMDVGLILCGGLFLAIGRPWRQGNFLPRSRTLLWSTAGLLLVALTAILWQSAHAHNSMRVARTRNFYGVLNVFRHQFKDPELNLVELVHGRVAHGVQFLAPDRAAWPTLYYSRQSGVGRALAALPGAQRRIGVIGLGAGTLAVYARPGDQLRFYEINPEVIAFAKTQFSYLQESPVPPTITLGDARLVLENEPPQNFDLLALDAFNSDSIPVHLLTREAFELYERHLNTNGVLAVNISNRSLDLEPVIAQFAQSLGLHAVLIHQPKADEPQGILPSTWVLLSRSPEFARWEPIRSAARTLESAAVNRSAVWTDDYSSLFSVIRWREDSAVEAAAIATGTGSAQSKPGNTKVAAAIFQFRQAVERDPNSPLALNNLACLLATAADASLRDGAEAVRLAERACALTSYQNTRVLSTLAAAYAEDGRFDDAVATAQKACTLATQQGQAALLEGNRRMLQYYRRNQPYHQPGS